ncbi:DUF4397 domain-containing protein [Mucilaginibacter terrenus]|uniref:DUF4397 domain-containing protein n=2 Tax=Mucilaginibacter terrenus TaxID=2482727 RepID=A0A3E2NM47_9SPHI|nr:DUF4397 domain-containing protein [Mucilaginibacter terrenus]
MNFKAPVFLVWFLMVFVIASCKKNDDAPSQESSLTTSVNVINASADTLNLYSNGSRINTTSSIYPLGSAGYLTVKFGEREYQFKKYGKSEVLFTQTLTLDTSKVYSLFITNQVDKPIFTTLDTLVADTSGRAKIRFVNASPDAGNLDVLIGDTVNFKVRAYQSASVFLPVSTGLKRIRVFKSGSTIPLSDTTRTLVGSRLYTLFSKGLLTGTGGNRFGTGLIVNR